VAAASVTAGYLMQYRRTCEDDPRIVIPNEVHRVMKRLRARWRHALHARAVDDNAARMTPQDQRNRGVNRLPVVALERSGEDDDVIVRLDAH